MVKIAIAGGSSNVAQEIIDALIEAQRHDIMALFRKDVPSEETTKGIARVKVDYEDLKQLTQTLQGVHTVLSFVSTQDDPASTAQKNLIDAAVRAGVKRFAPSEWGSSGLENLSWYAYKAETRRYLEELNKDTKVLEYTLFQPGLFVNYLTHPYTSSRHLHSFEIPIDLANRRAIVVDGGDDSHITLTTVQDLANVVARAVDFEGEWPVVGGIRGTDVSIGQLIALGEKLRGEPPFAVEKLKVRDLETGTWKTSWIPKVDHPSIPAEQVATSSRFMVAGILLAISAKAFAVSDEWNRLLPDYKFTGAEEFLTEAWREHIHYYASLTLGTYERFLHPTSSFYTVVLMARSRQTSEPADVREDRPAAKRRKVRKGTQSCWECKRRKVRCIFAFPASIVCDNCSRRGTPCISQEHPDRPVRPIDSNQVEARLRRVEEFIELLANNAGIAHALHSRTESLSEAQSISVALDDGEERRRKVLSQASDTADDLDKKTITHPGPSLIPLSPTIGISQISRKPGADKYEHLTHELIAAWPSQGDLDIICTLPVGLSAPLHRTICTFNHSSGVKGLPSQRRMLQLPPPGSHPVLIARQLLALGTYLQGVLPSSTQGSEGAGTSYSDVMVCAVNRAIRLVTTNDELVGSVEGIECIMLEAMYHNHAGNLHRAWMAVRRAISVAQMIALPRGLDSPSLKILDPITRATFDPNHVCFRLVQMDRYLSLMLGLPQGSLEAPFATPQALQECHPIDRMERIHCVVAGRILQRKDDDINNLAKAHDIDQVLQKAAGEVSPQWWLTPEVVSCNSDNAVRLSDTMRLMGQFTHYHLLTRLHLPYMLRSSTDGRYDHSKITAVNASREILSRYVVFRTSHPSHFYCRGIDFLAFVAITVMCIAHIESRRHDQQSTGSPNASTFFSSLAHSRPSDRGTMERTLDIIKSMALAGTDGIASKLSRVIHHLLAVEAIAAQGTIYRTRPSNGEEGELECDGKLTHGGTSLHVYISHLGGVDFERGSISKPTAAGLEQLELGTLPTSATESLFHDQLVEQMHQPPSASGYSPVDHMGCELPSSNPHPVSLQFGQGPSSQEPELHIPVQPSGAEDDWGLQGVDIALFNSLYRDTAVPDAVEKETWTHWMNMAET
ncbi:hypothetical protein BBP40_001568 [Aspergillus hancockii]|nr:hypothetical protein BBP40_001568 [Aspergillus hancockii]